MLVKELAQKVEIPHSIFQKTMIYGAGSIFNDFIEDKLKFNHREMVVLKHGVPLASVVYPKSTGLELDDRS